MVTNVTIVMELAGIRMAATIGDRSACVAKLRPTILYRMDIIKAAVTTRLPERA
jgi:hypothetical protein